MDYENSDSTCKSNEVSFFLMLLHTQVFNNPVFVFQYSQVVVEVRIYCGASGVFNFSLFSFSELSIVSLGHS